MTNTRATSHHFTVDVEEYFHATALAAAIPADQWDAIPRRSPSLVPQLLDRLDRHGVTGTFFVLGWLAEREPGLVREIAGRGHEIASHGWGHRKVTELTPEQFLEDVARSRTLLQEISGQPVLGYRAPSFSIVPGVEWALDLLLEAGYRYDSSTFPVRIHPGYGYPDADPLPHVLKRAAGELVEIPPTTLRAARLRLPAAGGAYLRVFPLELVRMGLRSAAKAGAPGTLYVHPWEWDAGMPEIPAPFAIRMRMTAGIGTVLPKLDRLLRDFEFGPIRDTVARMGSGPG